MMLLARSSAIMTTMWSSSSPPFLSTWYACMTTAHAQRVLHNHSTTSAWACTVLHRRQKRAALSAGKEESPGLSTTRFLDQCDGTCKCRLVQTACSWQQISQNSHACMIVSNMGIATRQKVDKMTHRLDGLNQQAAQTSKELYSHGTHQPGGGSCPTHRSQPPAVPNQPLRTGRSKVRLGWEAGWGHKNALSYPSWVMLTLGLVARCRALQHLRQAKGGTA